jgi:hypothetical protein
MLMMVTVVAAALTSATVAKLVSTQAADWMAGGPKFLLTQPSACVGLQGGRLIKIAGKLPVNLSVGALLQRAASTVWRHLATSHNGRLRLLASSLVKLFQVYQDRAICSAYGKETSMVLRVIGCLQQEPLTAPPDHENITPQTELLDPGLPDHDQ